MKDQMDTVLFRMALEDARARRGLDLAIRFDEDKVRRDLRGRFANKLRMIQDKHDVKVHASIDPDRGIKVDMIHTPADKRGEGRAQRALDEIKSYADEHGMAIGLTPDPPLGERGGMSKTQLDRWYKDNGFVRNKGRNKGFRFMESMIRPARSEKPATATVDIPLRPTKNPQAWDRAVAQALSRGLVSVKDAEDAGWSPYSEGIRRQGEAQLEPLPDTLYHVTSAARAVQRNGLLTRAERLEQPSMRGATAGLGGEDNELSLTTDRDTAESIRIGLSEMQQLMSGKLSVEDLIDRADRGDLGSEPFGEKFRKYLTGSIGSYGFEHGFDKKAVRVKPEDVTERTGTPTAENWRKLGYEPMGEPTDEGWYLTAIRPLQREATDGGTSEFALRMADIHRAFRSYRESAGGPEDPMLIGSDYDAFANIDPGDIAVLEVKPDPQALGYKLSGGAQKEWVTYSGRGLRVARDLTHDAQWEDVPGRREYPPFDHLKTETDYRGVHHAPGPDSGAPMHAVDDGIYPSDVYEHPEWYGSSEEELEAFRVIAQVRGKPDDPVTVYRAGPVNKLNDGDWVTPSFEYAKTHSAMSGNPDEDMPVWRFQVPASSLWTEGNSLAEFGFSGPGLESALKFTPDLGWRQSKVEQSEEARRWQQEWVERYNEANKPVQKTWDEAQPGDHIYARRAGNKNFSWYVLESKDRTYEDGTARVKATAKNSRGAGRPAQAIHLREIKKVVTPGGTLRL